MKMTHYRSVGSAPLACCLPSQSQVSVNRLGLGLSRHHQHRYNAGMFYVS